MTITTEQLDALEAGLEGVTPGPWKQGASQRDQVLRVQTTPLLIAGTIDAPDAAHIARCDPDTIRELIRGYRLGLEAERGWQPIETAPTLDRVLVAGWQRRQGTTRGYWYYGEDTTDEAGKPMEHLNALLWRPWPAAPTTPPTGGE
jgi:hypothetical protein